MSEPRAIERLQAAMGAFPQAELLTQHYWADGMYARELFRCATTLIVGKVHRKEHFYIVASGTVMITDGDAGPVEVHGPKVFVSNPGTKRAVYAVTDAVCITVHRTAETDIATLEAELVEPDTTSHYLPGNILKALK